MGFVALSAAFACGLLFALGLGVAGMTRPDKVVNFLDVFGAWDLSLAWVMAGAVGTYLPLYRWITRASRPKFAATFHLPQQRVIDARLIVGSMLFGAGWALSGYCPAPSIVGLGGGQREAIPVVLGIFAGFLLKRWIDTMIVRIPSVRVQLPTPQEGSSSSQSVNTQ